MNNDLSALAKKIYDWARGADRLGHEDAVARVRATLPVMAPGVSAEDRAQVERFLNTLRHEQDAPIVMEGDQPFTQWFEPSLKERWNRWRRYRQYLLEDPGRSWAFDSVAALDASSDEIVRRLGNPAASEPFDRRGLVVGMVQSGKTASYTALVAKALDAGYRVAIVLTGIHNSLRHQTQVRLDEELLGVGTDLESGKRERVGVGRLEGVHPPTNYLTGRGENGDFSVAVARRVGFHIGETPLLLVVKKNVTVLEHLINYLRTLPQSVVGADGVRQLVNVPLLLIDDEADQASVNFKSSRNDSDELDSSLDPSRVNEQIRKLLMTFSQRTYVGYTATPFANVLISHETAHAALGADLFPRDFIIALNPPDNYVGPRQVFGTGPQDNGEEGDGLPVVREVTDQEGFLPDRHQQGHEPGPLPDSLRRAVLSYLLAGAVRYTRGQDRKHHTMLVHVTRFTAVQRKVATRLSQLIERLRSILEYGSGARGTPESREAVLAEIRALYEGDFSATSIAMGAELPDWERVNAYLLTGLRRVQIRIINGDVGDVLDYEQHREDGAWILAVGGDKLSRGLTLEGLCVSYYLRASRAYDTLMQMGRWFGYRPGYGDLCRIYTTPELASWFQHIVVATEDLWAEFELMKRMGSTPQRFGLKVRAHPSMEVTSPQKMRESERISLNYSGTVQETVQFDEDAVVSNQQVIDELVTRLGSGGQAKTSGPSLWRGIPAITVTSFLRSYRTHAQARTVLSSRLADYIDEQVPRGLLTEWTVAVMSAKERNPLVGDGKTAGRVVHRFRRAKLSATADVSLRIKRLLGSKDELLDLTDTEEAALRMNLPGGGTQPLTSQDARGYDLNEAPWRVGRPATRGFLILYPLALGGEQDDLAKERTVWGMAISFPRSDKLLDREFEVNTVWIEQMTSTQES